MSNISLIERNINCSDISEIDFVSAIKEDMLTAKCVLYDTLKDKYDKLNEAYVQNKVNIIIEAANKKYKKEFYRQRYINAEISKINRNYYKIPEFSFADFDVEPDRMGIPYDCVISLDRLDKLDRCYNIVKDNDYFKKILGWQIIYVPSQRPYFKFITDPDTEKDMNTRIATHHSNVRHFLGDMSYFGD